ncbi:MAG: ribosome recycling factor [Bacteroidetes bacterium GWE2_29_8]|nr:MAG: ribosome recycling factor [Bacteroidetes bacterium GWE2_29_8]OFY24371.1 MAG: ribosome recycling factor [Bacteroidetes bacterium GWF2_29_10]
MTEEINFCLKAAEESMVNAITHLEHELTKIRAGRANPQLIENIMIDYYGSNVPITQVAGINAPDARTLVIQPWEKKSLQLIEKAIMVANIGIMPQNDGIVIRLSIPPLTEERRKEYVKKAKQETENSKVSVRNARREWLEEIKKLTKKGVPEDLVKKAEIDLQNITNKYIEKADKVLASKEKDIMTV